MPVLTRRGLMLPSLSAIFAAGVSGCSPSQMVEGASKVAKVVFDPNTPVGGPGDQPSVLNINLYAEDDINKNEKGQPSPIDVWLFQVGDPDKLKTTDFFTLTADPKEALGNAYVAHKDVQVRPGKRKLVADWKAMPETRFYAVVAGFRDLQKAEWSASQAINPTGEVYNILTVIKPRSIAIHVSR